MTLLTEKNVKLWNEVVYFVDWHKRKQWNAMAAKKFINFFLWFFFKKNKENPKTQIGQKMR